MMASDHVGLPQIYAKFKRHMTSFMVPRLWEARCTWLLDGKVTNWITAPEGAPLDGALLFLDDKAQILPADACDKFVFARKLYKGKFLLLDFKAITPTISPTFRGRFYYYRLRMQEMQRERCAAFIVQNPTAPAWAAVIPRFYLECSQGKGKKVAGGCIVQAIEMPLLDQPAEIFPMVWGPFVIPFTMLPDALKSLEDYRRDSEQQW